MKIKTRPAPSALKGIRFTLIELLVVVAIISILFAILLPSLRLAKDSARDINCRSNLKQCGVAFQSYAADFNGYMAKLHGSYGWAWILNNGGYLNSFKAFFCPTRPPCDEKMTSFNNMIGGNRLDTLTYGIWYRSYDSLETGTWISAGNAYFYIMAQKATNPSNYLYVTDTSMANGYQAYRFAIDTPWSGIELRHRNLADSLFLDAHVEGAAMSRLHDTLGAGRANYYANGSFLPLP